MEDLHGWNTDPSGRHQERYFSGGQPTTLVRDAGRESHDPVPLTSAPETSRGYGSSAASLPLGSGVREGWNRDPSGRHQVRYFDPLGNPTGWVSDGGQAFEDPVEIAHVPPRSHYESADNAHQVRTPEMTAAGAPHERPVGWYRNAANPNETKYWDGATWLERQPEPPGGSNPNPDQQRQSPSPISTVPIEAGAWHADPFERHRYRWLVAGVPTLFVSDDNGRVSSDDPRTTDTLGLNRVDPAPASGAAPDLEPAPAPARAPTASPVVQSAPANWYPDPSSPSRLRYWDGSDWTDSVLDESHSLP